MSSSIALICGIISCIVGVCTFTVGMISRAKQDGIMDQKLNQAVSGIDEIKVDLKALNQIQLELQLSVRTHEEQIRTLFNEVEKLENCKGGS